MTAKATRDANNNTDPGRKQVFHDRAFLLVTVAVSIAFAWIISPFYEAVLWSTVLAILFLPLHRRLTRMMAHRRVVAALCTVTVIFALVILPSIVITAMLVQEGIGIYHRIQSGELDFGRYLRQIFEALPAWAVGVLERFDLTTFDAVQQRLSAVLVRVLQYVGAHAVNVGQFTADFIVSFILTLYLLFFLLRDSTELSARIRSAIPLDQDLQRNLAGKFIEVVRATMKGTVVVAMVQGALGGLIFWILDIRAAVFWGVLMAFLSLLPALGTALVWLPVAVYFLVTGAVWPGIVLMTYGVLVIGLVDNVLRPVLVGEATKMPDYVVLMATLGGMAVFGFNGFVIGPVIAALFIAVWDVVARSRASGAS